MNITLEQLIEWLKKQKPDSEVIFDFCRCTPTKFASYRGYYEQLALGFADPDAAKHFREKDEPMTCGHLLKLANEALGKDFQGWKGGDYTMCFNTPLWADNPGNASQTMIIGCFDSYGTTILVTANEDVRNNHKSMGEME